MSRATESEVEALRRDLRALADRLVGVEARLADLIFDKGAPDPAEDIGLVGDLPEVHLRHKGPASESNVALSTSGMWRGVAWQAYAQPHTCSSAAYVTVWLDGALVAHVTVHVGRGQGEALAEEAQAVASALLWSRMRALHRQGSRGLNPQAGRRHG